MRALFTTPLAGALVAVAFAAGVAAAAQSGATQSPDLKSYIVSKDLGSERWAITVNLSSTNSDDVGSVTGAVFSTDGGPVRFVACLVRSDSTGSLLDRDSTFRLSCSGADPCRATAEDCARQAWHLISDDVSVPSSFFLPPGGQGATDGATSVSTPSLAASGGWSPSPPSVLGDDVAPPADVFTDTVSDGLALGSSSLAQTADSRGATQTPDRLALLVIKDIGSERWAIAYALEPAVSAAGLVVNRFRSITGNVYRADDSPPSFIFCTPHPDSTGTLDYPPSYFRLSCWGTGPCATTATDCAATGWTLLSEDINVQSSFFLPQLGLPATPRSDESFRLIGQPPDLPAVAVPLPGPSPQPGPVPPCPVGDECHVGIGTCPDAVGRVIADNCACLITDLDPSCITCGDGASGQCGGDCEYPVSAGATARGTCLPFSAARAGCACFAVGSDEAESIQGCGGSLGVTCPNGDICVDDPRGACTDMGPVVACPGVCVPTH